MKDYTKEIGFWKRLESFVSDVQTGCCAGEEEKDMILHVCKFKILHLQNVNGCALSKKPTRYRCLLCGRDKFTRKSPHNCKGGFRKRNIQWQPIFD